MKQRIIKLDYNGKEYISDPIKEGEEGYKKIHTFIQKVVDSDNKSFSLKCGENWHYFPLKIIENSIITITEEDVK